MKTAIMTTFSPPPNEYTLTVYELSAELYHVTILDKEYTRREVTVSIRNNLENAITSYKFWAKRLEEDQKPIYIVDALKNRTYFLVKTVPYTSIPTYSTPVASTGTWAKPEQQTVKVINNFSKRSK